MSTFRYGDLDLNVVYVDATMVASSGGTTPTLALNQLPAASSMTPNTLYLCRRSDTALSWASSTATAVSGGAFGIFVMGMPISGDTVYNRVDAEAISAWGFDSAEYTKINFADSTTDINFSDIDDFGLHRLWFVTPNTSDAYDVSYIKIFVNSSSSLGQYYVTNCKHTVTGNDLAGLSGVGSAITVPGQFLSITNARSLYFQNNNIEFPTRSSYTAHNYISFNTIRHVCFQNNNIWFGSNTRTPYTGVPVAVYMGNMEKIDCENNNIVLVAQNEAACYFGSPIVITNFQCGTIKNLNVTMGFVNQSAVSTLSIVSSVVNITKSPVSYYMGKDGVIIKDINVNFNKCWNFGGNYGVYLNLGDAYYFHTFTSNEQQISDISVVTPDTGGIGTSSGTAVLIYGGNQTGVQNISGSMINGGGMGVYYTPTAKQLYCKGSFYSYNCGFVEVDYLKYDTVAASIVSVDSTFIAHFKDIVIPDKTQWATQDWLLVRSPLTTYNKTQILIDRCTMFLKESWATGNTITTDFGMWGNNLDGIDGNWYATNTYYQAETSTTYRTGGSTSSLKVTGLSDTRMPLWLSPPAFNGTEWTPSVAGNNTVKVYTAFKNFPDPSLISKYFVISVEVPIQVNGVWTTKTYLGHVHGSWMTDTSTWNNDSGLTLRRCEIPIVTTTTERPVVVRMRYDWYVNTAYLYVDPQIEFV